MDQMRLFYSILLLFADRGLTIAMNAPVRNQKRIEQLRADVERWDNALLKLNLPPLMD